MNEQIKFEGVQVKDVVRITYEGVVSEVDKTDNTVLLSGVNGGSEREMWIFPFDKPNITLLNRAVQLPTAIGSLIKDAVTKSVYVSTGTGYRGVLAWGRFGFDYMQEQLNNGRMEVMFDADKVENK